MTLVALATRVVLIQGSQMYINRCKSVECSLYRYNICDGINKHRNCYDYSEWVNKTEEDRDKICCEIFERVRTIMFEDKTKEVRK